MIEITCDVKDTLNLSELTDFQGDLKHRSKEDVDKIITSIQKFGFATPFFVWSHDGINHVLDGHGRLLALKRLSAQGEKIPPLPIVHIDCQDESQAKKLLLRITSQFGEMTSDSVIEFMDGLEIDADELSLPDGTLTFDFSTDEEEDIKEDDIPDDVEPISQKGDIWKLGEHRLMCGDSTSMSDIENLINGKTVNLVLTDPPYGIKVVGQNGKVGADNLAKNGVYMAVKGDETTDTAKEFFNSCVAIGVEKQIIFGGNYFIDFLPFSDSWIIWDKRGEMASNNFADGEMAWCSFHTPVRIYKQIWSGMIREGEHDKRVHPTQKPVKMLSDILKDFSNEDDYVLDGFGGSGSTLLACEHTKRKCLMIEYEPHYCDVIIKRWENLTGQKAEKIN